MRGLMPGLALAALAGAAPADTAPPQTPTREWDFEVTLDGKPIGRHRFLLAPQGADGSRTLLSEADYLVKILGIPVYRYHHEARERWQGNCLAELAARTDDDGRRSSVTAEAREGGLRIAVQPPAAGGSSDGANAAGCLMTFAYWNASMRTQSRLLNPQTGVVEAVRIARAGNATVMVQGRPVKAENWRISGALSQVDVWYTVDHNWVGLDALLDGKRKLSYRLQ
ncbi:MAG: hypothetical protein JNM98_07510 [Rhodocyclaceae bacterium]|nr:hypothetical protein [Rhodocyclaceae bacterium]